MPMRRPIYNFAIDPELLAAIRQLKERDGISESEQIRRGIRLWLESKGVRVEGERQRGGKPRRRSSPV
ncbi:MAG: ribbon-helix-helix protein, CopG family [Vicinamibacterales bacterium]